MRGLIPTSTEVMIFAGLAVLCAAGAEQMASAGNRDAGLSFLAAPLFVFAAVMGLRRNWAAADTDAVMATTAQPDAASAGTDASEVE